MSGESGGIRRGKLLAGGLFLGLVLTEVAYCLGAGTLSLSSRRRSKDAAQLHLPTYCISFRGVLHESLTMILVVDQLRTAEHPPEPNGCPVKVYGRSPETLQQSCI